MINTDTLQGHEIRRDPEVIGLLAAVGNNEAKALLMGGMEEGQYYSALGLSRILIGLQRGTVTTSLGHRATGSYASESFMPLGLVAKADFGDVLKFAATEKGMEIGRATSGHLLDISNRHEDTSLRRLLGMTASKNPGLRPPYARYQIYSLLLNANGPISTQDIIALTGEPGDATYARIREMGEDKVVVTELLGRQGVVYSVKDTGNLGELSGRGHASVHYLIDETIKEKSGDSQFTTKELFDELVTEFGIPKNGLMYDAVKVRLAKLTADGVLAKEKVSGAEERNVEIAPDKKAVVTELVTIIDQLHSPTEEFISEGKAKLAAIKGDSAIVRKLLKKATENSPHTETISRERRLALVLKALSETEEPLAIKEIKERIGLKKMTETTIKKAVKELSQSERIEAQSRVGKSATKWLLTSIS